MYPGMYILATELSPVKSRSNTRTNLDVVASIYTLLRIDLQQPGEGRISVGDVAISPLRESGDDVS